MASAPEHPVVQFAVADFDPQLHASSAFFTTWTGVIRVDAASGDALVLRRTGDEEHIETPLELAAAIAAAYTASGTAVTPGSGIWLPLARLVPVLEHLSVEDALATCARMQLPALHARDGTALDVRPARIAGRAGWCGARLV